MGLRGRPSNANCLPEAHWSCLVLCIGETSRGRWQHATVPSETQTLQTTASRHQHTDTCNIATIWVPHEIRRCGWQWLVGSYFFPRGSILTEGWLRWKKPECCLRCSVPGSHHGSTAAQWVLLEGGGPTTLWISVRFQGDVWRNRRANAPLPGDGHTTVHDKARG